MKDSFSLIGIGHKHSRYGVLLIPTISISFNRGIVFDCFYAKRARSSSHRPGLVSEHPNNNSSC